MSETASTCAQAVSDAAEIWKESTATCAQADLMEQIVIENRAGACWDVEIP